jgi:hypothetical protein
MVRDAPLGFRVEAEVKAALERAATDDDRSVSSLVERILKGWLLERGYLAARGPAAAKSETAAETDMASEAPHSVEPTAPQPFAAKPLARAHVQPNFKKR